MRTRVCLAFACALALCIGTPGLAMTFQRVTIGPCAKRQCLWADGPIDKASIAGLRQAATANRLTESALIFVSSPGGDLTTGILLGEEIRKRGFDTFVAAYDAAKGEFVSADCASACFYMIIGGVRRGAGEGSRVGLHQLILNNPGTATQAAMSAQWFMSTAAKHTQDMGIDPGIVSLAMATRAESLRWLSRKELRTASVITLDNTLERPAGLGALTFFDVARQP